MLPLMFPTCCGSRVNDCVLTPVRNWLAVLSSRLTSMRSGVARALAGLHGLGSFGFNRAALLANDRFIVPLSLVKK